MCGRVGGMAPSLLEMCLLPAQRGSLTLAFSAAANPRATGMPRCSLSVLAAFGLHMSPPMQPLQRLSTHVQPDGLLISIVEPVVEGGQFGSAAVQDPPEISRFQSDAQSQLSSTHVGT